MRANEFITSQQLDEDWKKTLGTVGAAGALALGAHSLMKPKNDFQPVTRIDLSAPKPLAANVLHQVKAIMNKPAAKILKNAAIKAGLKGAELQQFMAQCAHETQNFSSLKEFGGSLDFRKYDPKYAPKKAAILGNTNPGDGVKYHGRGFIQLTGRENYKKAGTALGLPLEKHPELVEKPNVAAKVALWFWQHRVSPKVNDFTDTEQATKHINSGLHGLADRDKKFQALHQLAYVREDELDEYKADNDINGKGLGTTGYNSNVDYRGLRVLMKPSDFLSLAAHLPSPTSVDYIVQHMEKGGSLGSPFLIIDIPEKYFDGDFTGLNYAQVVGHEGRNRMLAIQKVEGDEPCEVHIFGYGEIRARHFTPEIIEQLEVAMRNQDGKLVFAKPGQLLFEPMA